MDIAQVVGVAGMDLSIDSMPSSSAGHGTNHGH